MGAMIAGIGKHRVGDRPDQYEPRAIKRGRKKLPRLRITRPLQPNNGWRETSMNDRTRFTGLLTAIVLIASLTASASGSEEKPKRAVSPPSMSKLVEAPVFAPLPHGQM